MRAHSAAKPVKGAREASRGSKAFSRLAGQIAHLTGRPSAFLLCCAVVLVWAVTGPVFHFSDTWQLIINTGTTIITFLMVFLIQNTQNREGAAIQAKLDELIRASAAQNAYVGIEHLTEEEVEQFRTNCEARAKKEGRDLSKHERAQVAAQLAEERANMRAAAAADRSIGIRKLH
jgi:low affinity Fe/Cu permease